MKGYTLCIEFRKPVVRLVLDDQILLSWRLCVRLYENCLEGEDVLLEEVLLGYFLQVHSEYPVIDGLVPFAVVMGAVLL